MPDASQLFADIDSMQPDRVAAHLAADVTMRFGNAPPIHGRGAVREAWASFCDGVKGVHHDQVDRWSVSRATIVDAEVTYTRLDDTKVTVPVVTIYRERDGLIADYRIHIGPAPLFAAQTEGP